MARFLVLVAAFLLPIYVHAVAFSVDSFEGIAVGKPMNLSWWGDKTPVTIQLMQGPPEALEAVVTLASNLKGETYTWIPTTIPAGTYVLSITQGSQTNYSPEFPVAGPPPPAGTTPPDHVAAEAAGDVLQSAVLPAYYPPAGYNNGSRNICEPNAAGSTTSAAFPCTLDGEPRLGRSASSTVRAGRRHAVVGASVGIALAAVVML